jgi:hypothetical protein
VGDRLLRHGRMRTEVEVPAAGPVRGVHSHAAVARARAVEQEELEEASEGGRRGGVGGTTPTRVSEAAAEFTLAAASGRATSYISNQSIPFFHP